MIFASFRKKPWENKSPHVRINAVQELLSDNNAEHNAILLGLIEQDDNELVRRAALTQLADFSVYEAQGHSNSDVHIQDFCRKQVDEILANKHPVILSTTQKLNFITELINKQRLEAWLQHESEAEIVIALYEKLEKPQLLLPIFSQKTDPTIQAYFIEQSDSIELLEKMLKKSANETTSLRIQEKLNTLRNALEKPIKLRKSTQLVLAKLLSIKDTSNYQEVLTKQNTLKDQWDECRAEFNVLPEVESQSYLEKYQHISYQLEQIFQDKAEQYQQALIAQKLQDEKEAALRGFNIRLTELNQDLTRCIFETEQIDEAQYQAKLAQLSTQITASVLSVQDKKSLLQQLEKQSHIIESLPIIALSITEATHLISRLSQLALPTTIAELNERYDTYQNWEGAWQKILKDSNGVLPTSIIDAHKQLSLLWKKGLKGLLAEQKALFHQAQSKIQEFTRLISAGKFNPSFYVYKKITALYPQLSTSQKQRLQREYDDVVKKHDELVDWEHYIATPRKQTLLDEAKNLVASPQDNPNNQAKAVKALRQKWNELGHAEDALENELNQAFNIACETAFAPCRLFYKEQEELRAHNLITREKVISQVQSFSAEQLALDDSIERDWKYVESQVKHLQNAWRSAGEVEKERYVPLNGLFNSVLKPIIEQVNRYHTSNKALKLALISSAEASLANDNIHSAVNEIKSLQQAWKKIGFSGSVQENKLWKKFRKINDEVFAKRDRKQIDDKAQQANTIVKFDAAINSLKQQLDQALTSDEIQALKMSVEEVLNDVHQHKPPLKAQVKSLYQLDEQLNQSLERLKAKAARVEIHTVFSLLEICASDPLSEESMLSHEQYLSLSTKWQKTFKKLMALNEHVCRLDKTLSLEIFGNIESPETFKTQRLALQVSLLQESLVNGEVVNLNKLLNEWILLGKLNPSDVPLLKRIAPIYC